MKSSIKHAGLATEDYRLLSEFRYVLRNFLAFSEERASALGLAPRQHQALLAIKGFDSKGPTVSDLAQRLVIRHNSAVGLINRLVAAGLVRRQISEADHRYAILVLTTRGHALLRKLAAIHRNELRRIAPMLQGLLKRLAK